MKLRQFTIEIEYRLPARPNVVGGERKSIEVMILASRASTAIREAMRAEAGSAWANWVIGARIKEVASW